MEQLIDFRKKLHTYPEISGNEKNTALALKEAISLFNPDRIYENIGGHSLAFEFSGENYKKTILFRADMDALAIEDEIQGAHRSVYPGTGHKCGHDGHMTILTGLAQLLSINPPENTRIVLLFQAEEETGTGALKVVESEWFRKLKVDYVFGLHNLPAYPKKSIVVKAGSFACSSVGLKLRVFGRTSHAGHPENGISPASFIAEMIDFVNKLNKSDEFSDFTLSTIIHIQMGEVAFGTSPGEAAFYLTLRSALAEDLEKLSEKIVQRAKDLCRRDSLRLEKDFTEFFPATVNSFSGISYIQKAAEKSGLKLIEKKEAFRWSEDFGHYLKYAEGGFFGLGAGENTPGLHHPEYDFPDDILETGIEIFYRIYEEIESSLQEE